MPEVNWNMLAQYQDPGQRFSEGLQTGNALMGQRAQMAYQNEKIQAERAARVKAARADALQQRAAAGDKGALAELAGVDLDAWGKLDARDKGEIERRTSFLGEVALQISMLPPEQRAQAWDSAVDHAASVGMPELAQYKGKYSDEALRNVIAESGKVKAFLDAHKIDWHQQGEQPSFATDAQGKLIDPQSVGAAGAVMGAPGSPGFAPTNQDRSIDDWAEEAISQGADPGAVARRVYELKNGGAGQGGPQTFP